METVVAPPTPEYVAPRFHRINSHSKLSEIVQVFKAPPVKVQTPQRGIKPWEQRLRLDHHVLRMKTFAAKSKSPDMNLTLREIQTGKKDRRVERIILALYTYFVGVAFLFFMFKE